MDNFIGTHCDFTIFGHTVTSLTVMTYYQYLIFEFVLNYKKLLNELNPRLKWNSRHNSKSWKPKYNQRDWDKKEFGYYDEPVELCDNRDNRS
jgi:hypothetical protein